MKINDSLHSESRMFGTSRYIDLNIMKLLHGLLLTSPSHTDSIYTLALNNNPPVVTYIIIIRS